MSEKVAGFLEKAKFGVWMAELAEPVGLFGSGQAKGLAFFDSGDDTGSVTSTLE